MADPGAVIGALYNQGAQIGANTANAAYDRNVRMQALQQRGQELQSTQMQQLRQQAVKWFDQTVANIQAVVKNNPAEAQKMVELAKKWVSRPVPGTNVPLTTFLGFDQQSVFQQLDMAQQTAATPTQQGINQGATAQAAAPAEAAAAAAKTTATVRAEQALKPTATSYYNPSTKNVMSVNESDPAQVRAAQSAGFVKAPISVQSGSLEGLSKDATEISGTIEARNRALDAYKQTGDKKQLELANKLDMRLMFGKGGPPQTYVQAIAAGRSAEQAVGHLYTLFKEGKSSLLPEDRQTLEQSLADIKLGVATLTGRGANFTDTEQKMITDLVGGDPTSIWQRALRSDAAYMENIKRAGDIIHSKFMGIVDAYTKPPSKSAPQWPWETGAGGGGAVKLEGDTEAELNAAYEKLPSGTRYIGPDNIPRTKP